MTSKSKPKPQAKISQAEPKPAPAIIVFGADHANKPRAASFTGDEVEAATKAAELMKLRVLKVEGPPTGLVNWPTQSRRQACRAAGTTLISVTWCSPRKCRAKAGGKPSSWPRTTTCSRSGGVTIRNTRTWSATAPQWRCSNPPQPNRQPQLEA